MARIRSIHPGFFTDEAVVAASPQAQVFLIGIWTQSDDQGVFEWKPLTLKMRILPATNCDVTVLLAELEALGIIQQIDVGPLKFGLVRNFRKYQRPKKPNSTFPLPAHFRTYVGLDAPSSPPVPHQAETSAELRLQMEDGGGRREEGGGSSEAKASDAAASLAIDDPGPIPEFLRGTRRAPPDPRKEAFDAGVKILTATGRTETAARKIIGKWRQENSDEAILDALGKFQIAGGSEPVSFITACLKKRAPAATPQKGGGFNL